MRLNDNLELQIKTTAKIDAGFILSKSRLGQAKLVEEETLVAEDDTYYDWQDILPGVIGVSIRRGVDSYTGAYALPIASVGTMHVRSTNPALDPNLYNYLQPRSKIRLRYKNNGTPITIFEGRVDNIYVDYRSDKDNPLISFDVMDPIAELQASMTKLSGLSSGNQTWSQRITEILSNGGKQLLPRQIYGGTTKHGYWSDNLTVWEALSYASNTEGGLIYFDKTNTLRCYASEQIPNVAPSIYFSNFDPTATAGGYKNISIDYNSQSIINEIQVQNSWGYSQSRYDEDAEGGYGGWVTETVIATDAKGPYRAQSSINKYGTHALNVGTNFHLGGGESELQAWGQKILGKWKLPETLVKEIEWDATKDADKAASIDILEAVNIKHEAETVAFEKTLSIIGIHHEINAQDNTWKVKYILFPRSRFI